MDNINEIIKKPSKPFDLQRDVFGYVERLKKPQVIIRNSNSIGRKGIGAELYID